MTENINVLPISSISGKRVQNFWVSCSHGIRASAKLSAFFFHSNLSFWRRCLHCPELQKPGRAGPAMPNVASATGVWIASGAGAQHPPVRRGMACDPQERLRIVYAWAAMAPAGGGPPPLTRHNLEACGQLVGRGWRCVRDVLNAAQGANPTLQRLPTGGAANSQPKMGLNELLYLRARSQPGPSRAHARHSLQPHASCRAAAAPEPAAARPHACLVAATARALALRHADGAPTRCVACRAGACPTAA